MTNSEAINWIINISADIGKAEHCDLWHYEQALSEIRDMLESTQPERKTGHWILNRSGAYCCSKCMEPCATYVMMKPRDRYCKMCGAKMEDERKE